MKELSLKEFYAQSMELKAPWKVVEVKIDGEARQVRIRVECARGEVWGDPDTNERAEIKDWEERTWRHLDTCQFETIITARVPRLLLKSGRTVTASVPWAAPRGRFTLSFEAHVIALLQHCRTVRGGGPSGPDHGGRGRWRDAPGGGARSAAPPTPAPCAPWI